LLNVRHHFIMELCMGSKFGAHDRLLIGNCMAAISSLSRTCSRGYQSEPLFLQNLYI